MPAATIAAEVHQSLDIHGHFAPAITLDDILILNNLADTIDIFTVKIIAVHGIRQIDLIKDFSGGSQTDTVDIGKGYVSMFVLW